MTPDNAPSPAARPEDVLPDGIERTTIDGVEVRKGTVAAFVRNAQAWLDPRTPADRRDALAQELVRAVPALRAVGVLDVFEIRDEQLRALVERAP